jgi:hypothetical protein
MTEETKLKMSISKKGVKRTIEQRQKMSNSRIGKIYINNGIISKLVSPKEPISDGWFIGRLIRK